MHNQRLHPLDISNRFSSKHDLYVYLDEHLVSKTWWFFFIAIQNNIYLFLLITQQQYLLPEKCITKDYMKAILRGDKKLLPKSDVKQVKVTKYEEIAVKTMYPILAKRPEIKDYFPDSFPKGRVCDKTYFWNVSNTVFPKEVSELIMNANALRFKGVNESD